MSDPLAKLIKKADAVADSASVLVSRTIREVRGEIANLSAELNLAGNADDRDHAFSMVRHRLARLGKRLTALMDAQIKLAAHAAADAAADMTGLEIRYSPQRAQAICELVTPAQGENLAAVFTDKMSERMISTLREATVAALREQAIAGGSIKELSRSMSERWFAALKNENPAFTDSSGRVWDTRQYFQMNARTNSMRVYNDCLVDNVARETGSDLMRISKGGDPDCSHCFAWEGAIISITGKTEGLPTYDDARNGGCFHPNCVHSLEYVDETADADEIALQKAHPVTGDPADPDAQDERRYEIDQARYQAQGLSADAARIAVDRDNLTDAIRNGLIRADARQLVDALSDAQVTRLCPDGNPPAFVPAKGSKRKPEPERWIHGSRGGVVHIKRDADLDHLLAVTKVDTPPTNGNSPVWKPSTALEHSTDTLMAAIGAKHTDAKLNIDWRSVNPDFAPGTQTSINCQRCAPTLEARFRGYDVTAIAKPRGNDDFYAGLPYRSDEWLYPAYKNPKALPYTRKQDIENQMSIWGDGARAEIGIAWKGGGAHAFFAFQKNGKTIFLDAQGYEGSPDKPRNADEFFNNMSKRGRMATMYNNFCRVDNLEFSDRAKLAFSAGNNV